MGVLGDKGGGDEEFSSTYDEERRVGNYNTNLLGVVLAVRSGGVLAGDLFRLI